MADSTMAPKKPEDYNPKDELAGWVTERVDAWRTWRDNNFSKRWDEYYRMYRGFWTEADRTRSSERSRIIGTELAQAVETAVAEIEDAIFARDRWIDVVDDHLDEDKSDVAEALRRLLDKYEEYNVKGAISEIILNGALYGTGIGKIVVDRVDKPYVDVSGGLPGAASKKQYCVKLVPISPRNFIMDPNASEISEALGCAHETKVPLSVVQGRIANGTYRSFPLTPYEEQVDDLNALGEFGAATGTAQACKVVEWHGLVPKSMLSEKEELFDNLAEELKAASADPEKLTIKAPAGSSSDTYVEAIVTVINDDYVARAVINPFIFGDRSIVAFPYDKVPNRFWGRGVAEKGYNPQKALDAEIRARIDALGFSTAPMMGIDSTKIPRGEKFAVRPGKNILTVGNPAEALMPLKFPPPDPYTFQQTQELREMIQRGTGSYELPANADTNRMAATSMSMIVGSMIKRSRRVLANIERHFLTPFVTQSLWRYMQFDPETFPMQDYKFKVKSAMGIMAREFEQGQLVSLLSTVPSESPAFWMLMKGIYTNSSIDERESMIQFCDQMLEKAMNPEPPPPDPKVMVDMQRLQFESEKWKDERDLKARDLMQKDEMMRAEAARDIGEGRMQTSTAVLQLVKAETEQLRAQSDSMLALAKAEAERNKAELEAYKASLEELKIRIEAQKPSAGSQEGDDTNSTSPAPTIPDIESLGPEVEDSDDKFSKMFEDLKSLIETQIADMKGRDINTEAQGTVMQQQDTGIVDMILELNRKVDALGMGSQAAPGQGQAATPSFEESILDQEGVQIERDANGLVTSVNGRPVKRNEQGLMTGIE